MKVILSIVACAALAVTGPVALAHDDEGHGHHGDQNEQGEHHGSGHEHHDNGKHLAKGHYKFDNHDHEIARTWCAEHRDQLPVGFRPADRLTPELEARLRIGNVLDIQLRTHVQPVPLDLARLLPPPPPDLRYMAIGGHVALVDSSHRLHDMLPAPPLPF